MFRLLGMLIGFLFLIGFLVYLVNNFDQVFDAVLALSAALVGLFIALAKEISQVLKRK